MDNVNNLAGSGNIPYAILQKLHNNYLSHKHKILSNDLGSKLDTKSVWFELNADLRNFLTDTLNDGKVSGIRIYFMEYPAMQTVMDDYTIPLKPIDVGQLTVGLVTTADDGTGKHNDYYTQVNTGKFLMFTPPLNHGDLCPQTCY